MDGQTNEFASSWVEADFVSYNDTEMFHGESFNSLIRKDKRDLWTILDDKWIVVDEVFHGDIPSRLRLLNTF